MTWDLNKPNYPYYTIDTRGCQITLVSCRKCGAALVMDELADDDQINTHNAWHKMLSANGMSFERAGMKDPSLEYPE